MSTMRDARKAKGLTLLELGSLVGVYPSTISRIERGLIGVSPDVAKRIGTTLGIDPAEIVFMDRKKEAA